MKYVITFFAVLFPFLCSAQNARTSLSQSESLLNQESEFIMKDPRKATLLSVGITVVGMGSSALLMSSSDGVPGPVIFAGSVLLGPSAGHMYSKNRVAVGNGILLRIIGSGAVVAGTIMAFEGAFDGWGYGGDSEDKDNGGEVILLAGTGLILFSIGYDFATASRSAKAYNERQKMNLAIYPSYDQTHNSMMLSLNVSF